MKALKSNRLLYLMSNIIAYLLFIGTVIVDLILNLNNDNLSNFSSIMYPTVITVAGFLITVYFLFLEIYKDRYPLEGMRKKLSPNTNLYLSAIIYNLVIGCAVLCIGSGFISLGVFCISSLATIISIIITISKSNKLLMLNSYIENICEEITKGFDNNTPSFSKDNVQYLKNILDECVIKEEYHTVGIIIEKTSIVFRKFLKSSISISESHPQNGDSVVEIFDRIVELNMFELELCKAIKSRQAVDKVVTQQSENLCFCIKNYQFEWYKIYFEEYLKFLYSIQKEGLKTITALVYKSLSEVIDILYDYKKNDYAKEALTMISHATNSSIQINNKDNSNIYIQFLAGGVDYAIEKNNKELLEEIIKKLNLYLYILTKNSDSFVGVLEYHKLIFNSILNYDINMALDLYKNSVEIFSFNGMQSPVLLECNMFCLDSLIEKDKKDNYYKNEEKLIKYHLDLLYQVSKLKEKYVGFLFFPDFDSMINSHSGNVAEINKIVDYIKKALNYCILGDNISLFYEFINKINIITSKTKINQKFIQEGLLSIYFWLIKRTHQLVNKQFLEITFFNLETVLQNLDKNRSISEALGEYIINNLHKACKNNMFTNEDSCIVIIDILSGFIINDEPFVFVITKNSMQQLIYKTLFNIGTECIENGFEEGVRSISNSLGWLTIKSIDKGIESLTTYLIERVTEFYRIANTMEISHKTKMFMLTLFPTVGAYACKQASTNKYCNMLIDAIINENPENVKTAVCLRTSENDMWNDLYDGQTEKLTGKFMKKYNEKLKEPVIVNV